MTARIEQPYLIVLFPPLFPVDAQRRRTGLPFEAGNAAELKRTLERVAARPELLATMAAACLDRAWKSTHACMHEARRRLIIDAFPGLAQAQPAGSTS